jgi:hypothetical protein
MVAHASVPRDAMLVVATPLALYLWDPTAELDEPPTYDIDARPLFQPYFEGAGVATGAETVVDSSVFAMIVNSWLEDLASEPTPVHPLLQESGFGARVRGGRVVADLVA